MKKRHNIRRGVWHRIRLLGDWFDRKVDEFLDSHAPERVIGDKCTRCSSRTMWQVHKSDEPCPRELVRWCMNCLAWVTLNADLRCETCNRLDWHPRMRKPVNDRSNFTVVRADCPPYSLTIEGGKDEYQLSGFGK